MVPPDFDERYLAGDGAKVEIVYDDSRTESGPAIFTARGGVYVRYGPPDELVQDVIPLNYDTLAEAKAVVENPYHPLNLSSSNTKLYFAIWMAIGIPVYLLWGVHKSALAQKPAA